MWDWVGCSKRAIAHVAGGFVPQMQPRPPPSKESLQQQGAPTLTGTLRPLKVSTSSCSSRPLLLQKAARTSAGQVRVQTADRYLGTLWQQARS